VRESDDLKMITKQSLYSKLSPALKGYPKEQSQQTYNEVLLLIIKTITATAFRIVDSIFL
jgi:hypothetical protein